jgi:hypothetical protein
MRARWPMAIHVTFQYGGMPARIRLRQAAALLRLICDWGMWLVDDEPSTRARPRLTAASTSTNGKYDPQGVGGWVQTALLFAAGRPRPDFAAGQPVRHGQGGRPLTR